MNPRKLHLLKGVRLAFGQGGKHGMKLVHLTPPIEIVYHADRGEARWQPATMPFKYPEAPLLIDASGSSDFPLLRHFIEKTNRSGWVAKFSSRFRSRRTPLDHTLAQEVIEVFEHSVATAPSNWFAATYVEVLPYPPPLIDHDRQATYQNWRNRLLAG